MDRPAPGLREAWAGLLAALVALVRALVHRRPRAAQREGPREARRDGPREARRDGPREARRDGPREARPAAQRPPRGWPAPGGPPQHWLDHVAAHDPVWFDNGSPVPTGHAQGPGPVARGVAPGRVPPRRRAPVTPMSRPVAPVGRPVAPDALPTPDDAPPPTPTRGPAPARVRAPDPAPFPSPTPPAHGRLWLRPPVAPATGVTGPHGPEPAPETRAPGETAVHPTQAGPEPARDARALDEPPPPPRTQAPGEPAPPGTASRPDPWPDLPALPDPAPTDEPLVARLWRLPVGGDDDPLVVAQRRR